MVLALPAKTSPVEPSSDSQSPSFRVTSLPLTVTETSFLCSSTVTDSAPATQGVPMPRQTTAAWLVIPPREVRMPLETSMPWISSGWVSLRTSTTGPFLEASTAASAVNAIMPTDAPGDAGRPLARRVSSFLLLGSSTGCRS